MHCTQLVGITPIPWTQQHQTRIPSNSSLVTKPATMTNPPLQQQSDTPLIRVMWNGMPIADADTLSNEPVKISKEKIERKTQSG